MNSTPTTVVDPVCGMTITTEESAGTSRYGAIDSFFCAKSCKAAFDADPAKYAAQAPAAHACCPAH